MGIVTEDHRADRQDLVPLANPQRGVDALRDRFTGPTRPNPGVVDKGAAEEKASGMLAPGTTERPNRLLSPAIHGAGRRNPAACPQPPWLFQVPPAVDRERFLRRGQAR
jgi:hypothetical protein